MEKAARGYRILEDGQHVMLVARGVSRNSIQCSKCQKWVHKKCSGIKGIAIKVSKYLVRKGCTDQPANMDRTSVDLCNGASVYLSPCLGDMAEGLGTEVLHRRTGAEP